MVHRRGEICQESPGLVHFYQMALLSRTCLVVGFFDPLVLRIWQRHERYSVLSDAPNRS